MPDRVLRIRIALDEGGAEDVVAEAAQKPAGAIRPQALAQPNPHPS
jgi:hypothetical protein